MIVENYFQHKQNFWSTLRMIYNILQWTYQDLRWFYQWLDLTKDLKRFSSSFGFNSSLVLTSVSTPVPV